jgi:hypothetical protein
MNKTMEKQSVTQMKPSRLRYIIAFAVLLLIIASLFVSFLKWEQRPDPASEKIIRGVIGAVLSKEPNDLNDKDFLKVTSLHLNHKKLSDIRLLEKLKNLEVLDLTGINFPIRTIPKWKAFLAKLSINTFSEAHEYDLSPLKKLSKLQLLSLSQIPVKNIEPIANLTSLKVLKINGTDVSNLEPLKGLHNLQELHILGFKKTDFNQNERDTSIQGIILFYDKFSDEQLENLKKALPNLKIIDAGGTFLR